MKAIVVRQFGSADNLVLTELPTPKPATTEVLIDVAFAGVGFVDTLFRSGNFDIVGLPFTSGIEVSGVIQELGEHEIRREPPYAWRFPRAGRRPHHR